MKSNEPTLENTKQFNITIKKNLQRYKDWRKKLNYCPALKENIVVSLKGWRHCLTKGQGQKRSIQDIYRRLKLLPFAQKILEKTTTLQNITYENRRKYFIFESVEELQINGKIQQQKVRVILIEDKKGNKIFYSVMNIKLGRKIRHKKSGMSHASAK